MSPLLFAAKKLTTFFLLITCTFIDFTQVSPPPVKGVTPRLFLPDRPRLSTILCKFAHNYFFVRVSPPWRVSSGAVRPPPPPSDATGANMVGERLSIFVGIGVAKGCSGCTCTPGGENFFQA